MQRIERYGVIALVFLLVTILAVSLWGEGKQGLKSSDRVAKTAPKSSARAADAPVSRTAPIESRGARDRALPTSQAPLGPGALALGEPAEPLASARDGAAAPADESPRTRRALAPPAGDLAAAPPVSIEVLPATVYVPPTSSSSPRSVSQPAAVATAKTVVVRAGETLSQIAERELGSSKRWPEIAACNGGLDPTKLRQGMILKLPAPGGAPGARPVAASAPASAAPASGARPAPAAASRAGSYVVRAGDVLSSIAQRELGSAKRWPEIVALNPGLDPERLIVGARLALPAGGSAPAKSAAKSTTQGAGPQVAKASGPPAKGGWSNAAPGSKVR